MTCREYLRKRSELAHKEYQSWPEEFRQHLSTCSDCARLEAYLSDAKPDEGAGDAMAAKIEALILPGLQPVRVLPGVGWHTVTLLFIASVVTAGFVWQVHAFGWQKMTTAQAVLTVAMIAGAMSVAARTISEQMLPGVRHHLSAAFVFAVGLSVTPIMATILYPSVEDDQFAAHAIRCWSFGVICAAVSAPLLWLVLRRGFPLNLPLHAASVGMFAGLIGINILELHCPRMDAVHKVAGHATVAITALLSGLVTAYVHATVKERLRA